MKNLTNYQIETGSKTKEIREVFLHKNKPKKATFKLKKKKQKKETELSDLYIFIYFKKERKKISPPSTNWHFKQI